MKETLNSPSLGRGGCGKIVLCLIPSEAAPVPCPYTEMTRDVKSRLIVQQQEGYGSSEPTVPKLR